MNVQKESAVSAFLRAAESGHAMRFPREETEALAREVRAMLLVVDAAKAWHAVEFRAYHMDEMESAHDKLYSAVTTFCEQGVA